jgi:hypothetical protein
MRLALLALGAAAVLAPPPPPQTTLSDGTARVHHSPLRRPTMMRLPAAALKSDDDDVLGEQIPDSVAGDAGGMLGMTSAEGMVGQRPGAAPDGGGGVEQAGGAARGSSKGVSRGQPKPRPLVDKVHQDKLHEEFLSKPEHVVERNIKGQTAGSVAARIEAATLTRMPPEDYYMCAQVYLKELGERTPLIHSLCTWWSQTAEDAPEREASERAAAAVPGGLLCKQIRKPRQCYRFDGDPFLRSPRLNDFTKQCSLHCLGKMTAGSREGVGGL